MGVPVKGTENLLSLAELYALSQTCLDPHIWTEVGGVHLPGEDDLEIGFALRPILARPGFSVRPAHCKTEGADLGHT